jgi:small-conductance mechanosensitive channel
MDKIKFEKILGQNLSNWIEISIFLVVITLIFLFFKIYVYRFLKNLSKNPNLNQDLISSFLETYSKFLKFLYFIVILNVLLSIEWITEYAKPILKYPIFDIETVKISISSLIKGIIVFYILYLLTKLIRFGVEVYLSLKRRENEIISTIDILIYNTALVFIVLITLSTMGISWKLLIPVAGALGIGLGFGLQDIFNNFISGFIILLTRAVKIGDWITLGDNFGKIKSIGMRTSVLRTLDNIDIIIPNSQLISNQLINWSYTDNIVRIHIPVGVSYGSDVKLVKETLLAVAGETAFVLDSPSPDVRFLEFGDSSLNFELLVWIDVKKIPIPLAKSELNFKIWNAFKENNIEIPFPQRDVWFKNELKIKGVKDDSSSSEG